MHLLTWRTRLRRLMDLSLVLRKSWVKMVQSLTNQMQSKPTLKTFRWVTLHFHILFKSYLNNQQVLSSCIFLCCNQNQRRVVAGAQDDMKKLSQDLETTEQLCSSLQQGYQEFCPDIQRQGTEVKQLQTRYANVANQLNERWESVWSNHFILGNLESQTQVGFFFFFFFFFF